MISTARPREEEEPEGVSKYLPTAVSYHQERNCHFSTRGNEAESRGQNHRPQDKVGPGDKDTAPPLRDSHVQYKTQSLAVREPPTSFS